MRSSWRGLHGFTSCVYYVGPSYNQPKGGELIVSKLQDFLTICKGIKITLIL